MKDRALLSAERNQIMTIFPMMRGGAVAFLLVTASVVQGCGSAGMAPTQVSWVDPGQSTAPYSGTAWYADLNHVMTTNGGGE
jgi:hypothetical protein